MTVFEFPTFRIETTNPSDINTYLNDIFSSFHKEKLLGVT
jgi:hypothetical protein